MDHHMEDGKSGDKKSGGRDPLLSAAATGLTLVRDTNRPGAGIVSFMDHAAPLDTSADDLDLVRELQTRLTSLEQEHRDLDDSITALQRTGTFDLLQVQRLKKRKLALKDEITVLRDKLLPDIIA